MIGILSFRGAIATFSVSQLVFLTHYNHHDSGGWYMLITTAQYIPFELFVSVEENKWLKTKQTNHNFYITVNYFRVRFVEPLHEERYHTCCCTEYHHREPKITSLATTSSGHGVKLCSQAEALLGARLREADGSNTHLSPQETGLLCVTSLQFKML